MSCLEIGPCLSVNIINTASQLCKLRPEFTGFQKLNLVSQAQNPAKQVFFVRASGCKHKITIRQFLQGLRTKFIYNPPFNGRFAPCLYQKTDREGTVRLIFIRRQDAFTKDLPAAFQVHHTVQLKQTVILAHQAESPHIPGGPLEYQQIRFYCATGFPHGRTVGKTYMAAGLYGLLNQMDFRRKGLPVPGRQIDEDTAAAYHILLSRGQLVHQQAVPGGTRYF